jgi:putative transposase
MLLKASAEVKYGIIREMISRDDNLLNIAWLCDIACVSRSGYYRWLGGADARNAREEQDKLDFTLILEAYNHRGYAKGAKGIYMHLLHRRPAVSMNIKKIRRLMRKFNLKCPIRKANPYRRMAKASRTNHVAPNLLNREFRTHGARAVLLTDITYIPRGDNGFSYLCTILDAFTKQVLAYTVSGSLAVDFVLETINKLVLSHGISLQKETLIHSDQGLQYTNYKFIQLVKDAELRQSMSRKANCWDNAPQESFYGHMKDKIDLSNCRNHAQIVAPIDDWMDYYNNERYQWDLARLSPNEYYDYISSGQYPLPVPPPEKPK